MPPEASHCRPTAIPSIPLSRPVSPREISRQLLSHKLYRGIGVKVTRKRFILVLFAILLGYSILRLLRIVVTTTASFSAPQSVKSPISERICSPSSSACRQAQPHTQGISQGHDYSNALTEKEFKLLEKVISNRAPCKLLVFGLNPQYLILSSINANGTTIFLEGDSKKIEAIQAHSKGSRVYQVKHRTPGKDAFKLLKHARENPACDSASALFQPSKCQLAMRDLPKKVYELRWDVIVIDGPSGHTLEAPGRMAAIYTASVLAKYGNMTNVVVHDTDRMIERWFSLEFLHEENLVSSKGKLWNFMIAGQQNNTTILL